MVREHKRVLILQPTKELIDKTVATELLARANPPRYQVFTQDTVSNASVAGAMTRFFNEPDEFSAQIVFATHQVFPHIPHIANKRDWDLLIDEEMQIVQHSSHRVPNTHYLITDDIDLAPYNAIYSRVVPRNRASMERKGRNKDDDELLSPIAETIRRLNNANWNTSVNSEQYERLRNGKKQTLSFHSILKPEILARFGSVFMAAANFEDTEIYNLWGEHHSFQRDDVFAKSLQFDTHQNGRLTTVFYGMESSWSKRKLEQVHGEDPRNNRDRLIDVTKQLFGDTPFLWQANKSLEKSPFGENAMRVPNNPRGLNTYAHIHDIVFLSALNPTPDQCKFLQDQGLSRDDVRRAIYYQTAYQSVMRTSIRDATNHQPKRIIVPDLGLAEYLQSKFAGSTIKRLDIGIEEVTTRQPGRPRKYLTNSDRVAQQRRMAKKKQCQLLSHQLNLANRHYDTLESWGNGNDTVLRAETTIEPSYRGLSTKCLSVEPLFVDDFNNQPCCGTLYSAKNARLPASYVKWFNGDAFVAFLAGCHDRKLQTKQENWLISPAIFDPNRDTGKKRGEGNIVYCRNIWLDFEDGDLKPDAFPPLFPHLKMVVMNTFHHNAENPRFRVVILTSKPITADAYKQMHDNIAMKLEDAGYWVERLRVGKKKQNHKPKSGLDWSKRTPSSLFYLPCQAQDPCQSFFRYYNERGRELLDPIPWIQNGAVTLQPQPVVTETANEDRQLNQPLVEVAMREWRSTPSEKGNHAFFMLGVNLRNAGMTANQIRDTLESESKHGRSPTERKAQIPSIMSNLFRKNDSRSDLREAQKEPE